MFRSRCTTLVVLVGATVPLVSCSAGNEAVERMATSTTLPPKFVSAQDLRFVPDPLEVPAGFEVVWLNKDQERHTVTSGSRDAPDGRFDVELPAIGNSFNFVFETAGTYAYFCRLHPDMAGQIVVV